MRRLIAVVDMEGFHGDALSGTTLGVRFMLPLVCSPSLKLPAVEPVVTLKKDTGEEIIDCGRGGDVCCRCGREGSC